jgi:hypothetical protein
MAQSARAVAIKTDFRRNNGQRNRLTHRADHSAHLENQGSQDLQSNK